MIEINEQQRHELENGKAIDVTDAETARQYVVLSKEVYTRIRHLIYDDSEWSQEELRLSLARSAKANGWDEPSMDAYDRYDKEAKKRCP